MAPDVNTTFRQIGIATGITAHGPIFASSLHHKLGQALAGTPSLHQHLAGIVSAIQKGNTAQSIDAVPETLRGPLIAALLFSFAGTLDDLLVVSAVVALVDAVCSLILIRPRDVDISHPQPTSTPARPDVSLASPAG